MHVKEPQYITLESTVLASELVTRVAVGLLESGQVGGQAQAVGTYN